MSDTSLPPALLTALSDLLGPSGLLTDAGDTEAFCTDWRMLYHGRCAAVLRPASTEDCAKAVALCAEHGVPMVPQGGNTSMVGGATPDNSGKAVVISTNRMTRIHTIDHADLTMTVEAGVTLKAAQDAAAAEGLMLPLSISSEGSAEIGGILATKRRGQQHRAVWQRAGTGSGAGSRSAGRTGAEPDAPPAQGQYGLRAAAVTDRVRGDAGADHHRHYSAPACPALTRDRSVRAG
nr:FAD-binding oxidoreductase [Acetobacter persici]